MRGQRLIWDSVGEKEGTAKKKKSCKALGMRVCVGEGERNDTLLDCRKRKVSQEDGRSIPPPSPTTNTLSFSLCIAHLCCSLISSHQHFISITLSLLYPPSVFFVCMLSTLFWRPLVKDLAEFSTELGSHSNSLWLVDRNIRPNAPDLSS